MRTVRARGRGLGLTHGRPDARPRTTRPSKRRSQRQAPHRRTSTITATKTASCCFKSCGSSRRISPTAAKARRRVGLVRQRGASQSPIACRNYWPSQHGPWWSLKGKRTSDNLARIGVLATCNAGGAGKWTTEHCRVSPRPAGHRVARQRRSRPATMPNKSRSALHGIAESVRIVELPGLPAKGRRERLDRGGGTKDEP